jgi:hypothetical protein
MFLKNYTSNVPVSETVFNIEKVLIRCNVSGITKEYGETAADVKALIFHIKLDRTYTIRLFADEEAALQALWLEYADGDRLSDDGKTIFWNSRKKKKREEFREQAKRTAWKLQQDWVEVQLSLIQMKQADFLQVFFAYLWDNKEEKTFYQHIKDKNFLALPSS